MIYACLFYQNDFVIGKPVDWPFSYKEHNEPFTIHQTGDLQPATEDYAVEVNGQKIMASAIDEELILGTE